MTHVERRRRDGYGVSDWTRPARFIEHCFPVIRNRVDMFLEEHSPFSKQGACTLRAGVSVKNPPAILVLFSRNEGGGVVALTREDETLILTFMYGLIPRRMNLKFVETEHTPFHFTFEIVIRVYYPFEDKQDELDIFGRFGGNASPPDITKNSMCHTLPWQPPHFSPKGGQFLLDLGPFCHGNSMPRMVDARVPNVRFSLLDPGEVDDVRFDYPDLPERIWQQLELGLVPHKLPTPCASEPRNKVFRLCLALWKWLWSF